MARRRRIYENVMILLRVGYDCLPVLCVQCVCLWHSVNTSSKPSRTSIVILHRIEHIRVRNGLTLYAIADVNRHSVASMAHRCTQWHGIESLSQKSHKLFFRRETSKTATAAREESPLGIELPAAGAP